MQLSMVWVRAGCLCGAGTLIAIVEDVRSGSDWDVGNPWSFAVIAAATAVAAALGRTIYAMILKYNRPQRR